MSLLIKQADKGDKNKIFQFISVAYPELVKYKIPERWEWEFENNPFRRGNLIIPSG